MKVILIDYTGKGSPDPLYAARLLCYSKSTRLEMNADGFNTFMMKPSVEILAQLEEIANTIRSSWEFVDYTFQIMDVTRAFTHQLVRTRTASYAQQAQRVVNMSDFSAEMPDTVKADPGLKTIWLDTLQSVRQGYRRLAEHGVPAQDCRGLLPTNVHTNIMMKANLRTLADLLAKRKNLRAQGEYGAVAAEWERLILEVHPWAKPFLSPERTATPALDKLLRDALGDRSPVDRPDINAALKELDRLKAVWG